MSARNLSLAPTIPEGTGEGLAAQALTKRYRQSIAVQNVNVLFKRRTIYGLLGENGAGKSTFLRLLAGRSLPSGGRVSLDGYRLTENSMLLPDIFLADEAMESASHVETYFRSAEASHGGFDWKFAHQLVSRFNLPEKKRFGDLSMGYRMIAKIIAALCTPCEFVLLDEPTGGMDVQHRKLFTQTLLEAYSRRPRTFVISSHLITEIAPVISDAVILHHGSVLAEGSVENLLAGTHRITGSASALHDFLHRLPSSTRIVSTEHLPLEESEVIKGPIPALPSNLSDSPIGLEELFLALTAGADSTHFPAGTRAKEADLEVDRTASADSPANSISDNQEQKDAR